MQGEKAQSVVQVMAAVCILFLIFSVAAYFLFLKDSAFTSSSCHGVQGKIMIEGDLTYREIVQKALAETEKKDCKYSEFIFSNVKKISASRLFIFRAGEYREEKGTIHVDPTVDNPAYAAGVIMHEACHSYQDKLGAPYSETDCATTQYNFLLKTSSGEEAGRVKRVGDYFPQYQLGGKDVFEEWLAGAP
ncbi:Uncharacterised protein [uncultured archaeon]|nr:Uncharacterised protein [uncultured archaeon]